MRGCFPDQDDDFLRVVADILTVFSGSYYADDYCAVILHQSGWYKGFSYEK